MQYLLSPEEYEELKKSKEAALDEVKKEVVKRINRELPTLTKVNLYYEQPITVIQEFVRKIFKDL